MSVEERMRLEVTRGPMRRERLLRYEQAAELLGLKPRAIEVAVARGLLVVARDWTERPPRIMGINVHSLAGYATSLGLTLHQEVLERLGMSHVLGEAPAAKPAPIESRPSTLFNEPKTGPADLRQQREHTSDREGRRAESIERYHENKSITEQAALRVALAQGKEPRAFEDARRRQQETKPAAPKTRPELVQASAHTCGHCGVTLTGKSARWCSEKCRSAARRKTS